MASVQLYEDNAGGLYLYHPRTGTVWAGLQNVQGASFSEDAAAIEAGETADWNLETYPDSELDGTELVATFHKGGVSDFGNARRSARAYLDHYNERGAAK